MTTGGGFGGGADVLYVDIQARLDGFEKTLREMEQEAQGAGERSGGLLSNAFGAGIAALPALAATAAAAVGTALAAGATAAFDIAKQSQEGLLNIQSQLGVTAQEAEALGETAKNVFANNWGESLTEAQNMVIEVRKQMRGLADEELDAATQAAAALADTFGTEVGEQAMAANTLMEDFGLTSQQAFDFIAAGFQNGLNNSGDFLETITEYSTQFKNGGASAEEFFSIMQSGQQGGMLGVDRAADAFKEFVVRIQDGSKSTAQGLESIGLNAGQMAAQMADGSLSAADAFQQVVTALNSTDDANLRMQAGVALIGTQFEDLGADAALGLSMATTSMNDLAGAAESVGTRYNTLGAAVQGVWRQVLLELEPVGAQMLSMVNDAVPGIKSAISTIVPVVGQMVSGTINLIEQAKAAFGTLGNAPGFAQFKTSIAALQPVAQAALGAVSNLVSGVLVPAFQNGMTIIAGAVRGLGPVMQGLGPLVGAAVSVASAAINLLVRAFQTISPIVQPILPIIAGTFQGVGVVVSQAMRVVTGVLNAVAALMRGDVPGAVRAMQGAFAQGAAVVMQTVRGLGIGIKAALSGLPAALRTIGTEIVNGLIGGIRAGVGRVAAAARSLASSAVSAAKNALGIRSPSRVMFGLGEWTGIGFAKGVDSKQVAVVGSAKNLAGAYVKAMSKEVAEGQAKINEQLAKQRLDGYIRAASDAQLAQAKTAAYAAGNVDKYNAVVAEQKRRADAAAQAIERVADAQTKIRESEQFDAWKLSLEGYSDAQLDGARAAAFAAGDQQRYNTVVAEQERRVSAAADATERLAQAQRDMVGVLIDEGFAEVLDGLSNEDLAVWRDQSFIIGDKSTWAAARKAMQDNGKETAQGFIEGANELLKTGNYTGALAQLREGLELLGDETALGYDVSQGVDLLAGRIGALQNALGELDPVLASVVANGGELFDAEFAKVPELKLDTSWEDFLLKLEDKAALDAFTDSLTEMDAEQLQAALSAAMLAENQEQVNAVLAAGRRYTEQATQNSTALTESSLRLQEAQASLAGAVDQSKRPFADQILMLENLRGKPGVVAQELEWLIAAWKQLQAETEKQSALEANINKWSNYAKQALPVIVSGIEALGLASGEVAGQWGEDLGRMTSDITNFAMALAKGDYVGAAVQGLMTIFNWLNRNAEAARKAAKATADYNAQFQFSQNGYGTRQVETYTTGVLFWQTTHYKESVNEAQKQLALALEGGFVNGIQNGFKEALKTGDFSQFEKSLKTSVGQAVLDGLIESFINQAVVAEIIGPAIEEYMRTGDAAALERAIERGTAEAKAFMEVIEPLADKFGLVGEEISSGAKSLSDAVSKPLDSTLTLKGALPNITLETSGVMTRVATVMADAADRQMAAANRMYEAVEFYRRNPQRVAVEMLDRAAPLATDALGALRGY